MNVEASEAIVRGHNERELLFATYIEETEKKPVLRLRSTLHSSGANSQN
jgi:hypothetical protein